MVEKTTSSSTEVVEAVNHLQIVRRIQDFIGGAPLNEAAVLEIHKQLMQKLLTVPEEGGPGEYRKVEITIDGASVPRIPLAEVLPQMCEFFEELVIGKLQNESIYRFLARIHKRFQLIHPFRDGNGRTGRIIMNILALQHHYPVIYYATEHCRLFCSACDECDKDSYILFERMIQEAFYVALRAYEKVTPEPLIVID